jgi:creatinine amidohydrolase
MSRVLRWGDLTREELAVLAPHALVVVPVGSTEQHGPHLPTSTDAALVTAVAERAAAAAEAPETILLAPTLAYGASQHHLPFGATLSLRAPTLAFVLADLAASAAASGCRRLFFLNGHGGNHATCTQVARDAALEHGLVVAAASYWDLIGELPGHAGHFETSLSLALGVEVREARPAPERIPPPARGLVLSRPDHWQRIDGFTDDPREATAEAGAGLLEACARAAAAAFAETARA